MLLGDRENRLDDMFMGSTVKPEVSAMPATIDQTQSLMDLLGLDMNNSPDPSLLSLKKIKKRAQDLVENEVIALVLNYSQVGNEPVILRCVHTKLVSGYGQNGP